MTNLTRRDAVKLALTALAAGRLQAWAKPVRPDSRFGNVQIGIIISPYNYPEIPVRADELLGTLVQLGISAIEMQDVRVETYAGAPSLPREGYSGSPSPSTTPDGLALSAQEQAMAQRKAIEELRHWRLSAPLHKYKALRKLYHDAGVNIYAFRLANMTQEMPDSEYEYFFNAARALGANQITVELPEDPKLTERVGNFAAKHKIRMGYHNHTQVNAHSWDFALAQSPFNGINFDVGHYAAATGQSPISFIEEHHDRITSLHLKDRRFRINGGRNMPWGQGETSLKEVLKLVQRERYPFPAAIELEYRIPQGSTATAEIAKCRQFCKDALT
jgi:sugar phosphate isomerase/epimerase